MQLAQDTEVAPSPNAPNPEGMVVEADAEILEAMKASGPVLVEFYAPWCPQ